MNKKIERLFFLLIIYNALLTYGEEEIKHDPKQSENLRDDKSINENKDNINTKINEEIESNSNKLDENDKTSSIDNNPVPDEKIDLLNSNSNVDEGSDSTNDRTVNDKNLDEEPIKKDTKTLKGVVNSEKETVEEPYLEEKVDSDPDISDNVEPSENEDELLKPIQISKVKVIRDNVTGHKRSSFSEDKTENRGDENTVSQLKEEAENRILEKEKEKELIEGDGGTVDPENIGEQLPLEPEVIVQDTKDSELKEPPAEDQNTDGFPNDEFKETLGHDEFDSPSSTRDNDKVAKEDLKFGSGDEEPPSFDNGHGEPPKEELPTKADNSVTPSKEEVVPNEKETIPKESDVQKKEVLHEKKAEKMKSVKETPKKEKKEQPGAKLYEDAMGHLNKKDTNKGLKILAYKLLAEAADISNTDAAEKIAYPYMFGDFIKRNRTKAVELFHYLAAKGNPLGQQGLGFIYGAGLNVNSSQAKALIYTTFAALGGNAMASMMLGYRYLNGIGVAKSCESALTHYKKVAKKVTDETTSHGGNAVQRIRLYDELEQPGGTSGQIDEDLLQYYQFLADKGDLQAQVGLGQLYFQGGRGIDVNYEKAFKYFQLAGDVDNGNGLAYLGKMYLDGLHVEKDQKKAFEYFTKAAEQSNPIGQAGLGMIYLKGAGVKKDYDQAMKYFSQAAEQGWMEGQLQLGNMYYNGIGVKKDYRQAVKYFTFASQSGHVMAFYNLASMHATGAGVMRSCSTATELFKNVAERGKWSMMFMDAYDSYRAGDLETALLKYYYLAELGYEVAQSNVAYVLEKGELPWFPQNQTFARALLQWSRAAHQGYAVARVKVGDYHFYGYGTKIDYDAAALHYRTASDQQNNPQAMFNLGYMHEQGFGLKEDIHLAKRFYDMAAEASPDAHFPVTLALMKLTLFFTWDWMKKNYRFWEYGPFLQWWTWFQEFDPDWDMFLITVLAILLGALLLFRRTLRR